MVEAKTSALFFVCHASNVRVLSVSVIIKRIGKNLLKSNNNIPSFLVSPDGVFQNAEARNAICLVGPESQTPARHVFLA